jgi:hypothetical protein
MFAATCSNSSNSMQSGPERTASECPAVHDPTTNPPIGHVFIIVLENESYEGTFGEQGDKCLKALAKQGTLLRQYYGIGHNSMDNYIAMVSGQSPNFVTQQDCPVFADFDSKASGVEDLKSRITNIERSVNTRESGRRREWRDRLKVSVTKSESGQSSQPQDYDQLVGAGCVYPQKEQKSSNIADQLTAAHKSWRAYMEGMSGHCEHPRLGEDDETYRATGDEYATRHNPFVYFHSLIDPKDSRPGDCHEYDVPLGTGDPSSEGLAKDLKHIENTPTYVFITPNLCHDGHNTPCVNEPAANRSHRLSGLFTNDPFSPRVGKRGANVTPNPWPDIHAFLAK